MEVSNLLFLSVLIVTIFVSKSTCRTVEVDESDSIEIPTRKPHTNTNNGFSVFRPADDALFNFINKIVNTSYLSSKMALNRIKNQSEIRKKIEDEVEEFLENLPNVPIPILDDLGPMSKKTNYNIKDSE